MRQGILALCFALAAAGVASADNNIGCGLGTQVWEGSEGLAPKVLGATTNGTFGNQTFGITTGTLGCKAEGIITADARLQMYASANLDNLARDMARGNGETLATFSHLMAIDQADQPAFYEFTRRHFAEIFARGDVTAGEMLAALDSLLVNDPRLSAYVRS